jgi:hypothetical protein
MKVDEGGWKHTRTLLSLGWTENVSNGLTDILSWSLDVLSSCSKAPFTIGVEMDRVDWGIVIVPRDEQWRSLHGEHESSMPQNVCVNVIRKDRPVKGWFRRSKSCQRCVSSKLESVRCV